MTPAALHAHARALDLPVAGEARTWFGARPTLPDYLPAIGRARTADNLLYAFGHQHLGVTLAAVTSRSQAGKPLAAVIPAVRGADRGLTFTDSDPAALAAGDIDLFFLALPHGAAAAYASALAAAGKRVIDLSADFRIADLATYQKYYGEHPAPALLASARFVLPELTPPAWKTEAKLVAAPGCYPTSILVPLVPLLMSGLRQVLPQEPLQGLQEPQGLQVVGVNHPKHLVLQYTY